jgi:hypothetical protein
MRGREALGVSYGGQTGQDERDGTDGRIDD